MSDRVSLDPLPYYKWHWLRWRASRKVQRMSILERGIYRELLDEQWAQGCIRDDTATLSEILDDSQQVLEIAKQVLSKCFTEISPGVWQNSTLEEQRTETDKIRSNRKIAGTLGALAKAKPTASAEQVLASAEQVPYREREERVEEIREKPSRAKAARAEKDPTKTDLAKARHADFKTIIAEYWTSKNPGVQMPWDGREGKHLEMFLRAAPDITTDQFRMFLRNRYKSEVNHGERASQWIDWVASYAAGPVDRFGKTIQTGGENGTHQPSAAKQRLHDNRLALAKAAVKRGWIAPDDFAGEGAEALAEPGHSGIDGGIPGGLRAVGPEILPPEDRGGAKGPAN